MNEPKTLFTVIYAKNCPIYRVGDDLALSGLSLTPPTGKAVCISLASAINALSEGIAEQMPSLQDGNKFDCSGCGGIARLAMHRRAMRADWVAQEKTLENIASILSTFSMFQSLDDHQIKHLVSFIRLSHYEAEEQIIVHGAPGRFLYILLSGRAVVLDENGHTIARLKKGDVFGEMSLLSGEPAGAAVKAVTPVKALHFKSRNFRKVLHTYPSLQLYLARLLTKRLARTTRYSTRHIVEDSASGFSGSLADTPAPEICQTINLNAKTGALDLVLQDISAQVVFRDGQIIKASYEDKSGRHAFFEILKINNGRFHFRPELGPEDRSRPEIGNFMCLLMEGISRMDEEINRGESADYA